MILLTTSYSAVGSSGFVSVPHATATSKSYDWVANSVSITYSFGTATSSGGITSAFLVAPNAPTVTNTMSLNTGVWHAVLNGVGTIGQGTLTGPNLAGAITVYSGPQTALRDAADFFAMGTFLPGTQPDLWGSGDI